MKYPAFAKRFREACAAAGAPDKQVALGKFLGVSGTMAWNYRNGEKLPAMDTAISISTKLGVSLDWLMTGRGPMELLEAAEEKAKYRTDPGAGALTREARTLVEKYERLDPKQRTHVQAAVDAFASARQVNKKTG